MTSNVRKLELRLLGLTLFALLFTAFIVMNIFLFAFKDTSEPYSLTRTWKEYHSVEDWNLSRHARVDIDQDGKTDLVTFTNCAFLSNLNTEKISLENRCEEPGMLSLVWPDNNMSVGQKLVSQSPFQYQWLRKSYLVKTHADEWKFYDLNGFQTRVYRLDNDLLFQEVRPSLLDIVDTFTYQIVHLGVVLIVSVLS